MQEIKEITERDSVLDKLLEIWEASVRATHHFLQEQDIVALRPVVKQALLQVEQLAVVWYEQQPAGFLGAEQHKVEMLFIDPARRGRGLGRQLMTYAIQQWQCNLVDVNEQNEQAVGFYQHVGFAIKSRSPFDEQGNPFPILHLELSE